MCINFRISCYISSTGSKHKEKIRLWGDDIHAHIQSSCGFWRTWGCESVGLSQGASLEYTNGLHCVRLCDFVRLPFVGRFI